MLIAQRTTSSLRMGYPPKNGNPKRSHIISVDSTKSFEDRVKAGMYDKAHPEINGENFPVVLEDGNYSFRYKIFAFDQFFQESFIMSEMDKEGFRPANTPEVLAFGEVMPLAQTNYRSIVALGARAKIGSDDRVICLDGVSGKRYLCLEVASRFFDKHSVFLGVKH